jgi:hypothetical protein
MVIINTQKVNSRLEFLICSLFVLVPTDKLFKQLNLNADICLKIKGQSYILYNWKEIKILLNDPLIRQFSYILIRPLIFRSLRNESFLDCETKQEFRDGAILLQEYLKKFRAFYKHYFLPNNGNTNFLITDKDINSFAIEALFLLVGI